MIKDVRQFANAIGVSEVRSCTEEDSGDCIHFGSHISQEAMAKLLSKYEYDLFEDDMTIQISLPGGITGTISLDGDMIIGNAYDLSEPSLLNAWWDNYGQYAVSPINDEFANILRKVGIDTRKIEGWVREAIKENWVDLPECRTMYGNLDKYGFSKQEIAEMKELAKQKEPIKQDEPKIDHQVPDKDLDIQGWENEGGSYTESLKKRLTAIFGRT